MIGHSFLHGGFSFSGLSLPVVTLLTGGSIDTAASALTLEDCPDIDHRETIGLTVIQSITWPQPNLDSDKDEEDTVPLEKISLVTGFLRKFIEYASTDVLRDLMKFWVGWEMPTRHLNVEVVTSTYPVALTCFFKLKLPSHYQIFHQDLMMALSSIRSGFGLV